MAKRLIALLRSSQSHYVVPGVYTALRVLTSKSVPDAIRATSTSMSVSFIVEMHNAKISRTGQFLLLMQLTSYLWPLTTSRLRGSPRTWEFTSISSHSLGISSGTDPHRFFAHSYNSCWRTCSVSSTYAASLFVGNSRQITKAVRFPKVSLRFRVS